MKNVKYFFLILICGLTINCTNNNDANVVSENDFIGYWLLSSAESSRLIDYNYDGVKNMDIVDDFDCLFIELILNEDYSFSRVQDDRLIINSTIICNESRIEGVWSVDFQTNKIIFEYGNDIISNDYYFALNNTKLIIEETFDDGEGDFMAKLKFTMQGE
ncbi:MAG: hypothetical protein L3J14_01205 [Flavobacteriaceae bacterium]|nr:hypothetical protein [Flavobacteriaceae bacterium]